MEIVRTRRFIKDMKRLGANEADIERLEQIVANAPLSGSVIPGLGGLRKLRFQFGNRGKRGGGRAIYFLMIEDDRAVLLFAYAKSVQDDLSPNQKKAVLLMMQEIKRGQA